MKTITEDEFWEQYKPVLNHFHQDENREWNGCMYETFGEELAHVLSVANVNPQFVWTILDSDGLAIVSGYHLVNRMGYLITEFPADEDFIDVEVEDLSDYSEEDLAFLNGDEEE